MFWCRSLDSSGDIQVKILAMAQFRVMVLLKELIPLPKGRLYLFSAT